MSRSPLLNQLQELYRDFVEAEATDRTVDAVQDARRTAGQSRRDFLKTGAVAAAGVVIAPRLVLAGPAPRIAIVGGGISGLNAALTLQDAGVPFTIYEGSSRIGGRVFSDRSSWGDAQITEHGGELIDSTHKTILGLAKRFGIRVDDVLGAEPTHSTDTYFFGGEYYSRAQANVDFNAVYKALKKDAIAASYPTTYASYTPAGFALDQMSIYDWIESRVPGGHVSRMGRLLDVAYDIEYGAPATEQSALNLIYLLAFQSAPGNFRMFGRSDERYHLRGGNDQLPRAIAASLPASAIRTGTRLQAIARNDDGSYTLAFANGVPSVVADRVILAIPFSVLRTIDTVNAGFTPLKRQSIDEIGYGTNAKLHLQFTSRFWNESGPWGLSNGSSFADTGYQNTWEPTRGQRGAAGVLLNFTGSAGASLAASPLSTSELAQQFLDRIEPVFPGLTSR